MGAPKGDHQSMPIRNRAKITQYHIGWRPSRAVRDAGTSRSVVLSTYPAVVQDCSFTVSWMSFPSRCTVSVTWSPTLFVSM
jgi:hypothetical protein